MNDLKSVEDTSNEKNYDSIDKRINQGNDMKGCPSEGDKLTLALRLQHDKKHESRRIFKDEVLFHKHEQIAMCCMKVCFLPTLKKYSLPFGIFDMLISC